MEAMCENEQQFVFYQDKLLLKITDNLDERIPCSHELPPLPGPLLSEQKVYFADGSCATALALDSPWADSESWRMVGLRASYDELSLADYQRAGKAYEILYWDSNSRFCPACGTPTVQQTPIMKQCPQCGKELYPPISTAVIVLITKGDEILLVHARNFRGTFYGLVAGFLEAGETLEECVHREVREETGLKIKNLRYFGSQPWPYPSGLMVGFIADYDSGTIKLQHDELSAGAFYHRDALPEIPRKLSIARKLIDWWLEHPIDAAAAST